MMKKSYVVTLISTMVCTFVMLSALNASAADPKRPFGSQMNPDIGANALMLYRKSNRGNYISSSERNGPSLQEVELSFSSDVDPYWRLRTNFSAHQADPATGTREGEWEFEPEEAFAETIAIPSVTLKFGKFKAALGKHNILHTHAYPFIDAPLFQPAFLGDEGLNDYGASAAYLVPVPWFMELTAQFVSGRPESDKAGLQYFNNNSANAGVYVARLVNLVDLNDATTAEIGLSGALGSNEFDTNSDGYYELGQTEFMGADMTFKWRPTVDEGKKQSLAWATEYLRRRVYRPASSNIGEGFATWLQWQADRNWWLQARWDYLEMSDSDASPVTGAPFQRRYTAAVGYSFSEFSAVRMQYSHGVDDQVEPERKFLVQLNYTIGVHPAHVY